jgi:hypothetical protein
MFEKREYRMYNNVKRQDLYPQVCDYWARLGFYVGQISPFQIRGESFHSNIGLRREFYLRLDEQNDVTYVDLMFRARITDAGAIGGAAAAVLFWPVAVVGGAVSYTEYENDARNLMFNFWGFMDQIANQKGNVASGYTPPPPPEPPVEPEQADNVPCKECGALLPKNWKACPYCGKGTD